MENYKYDKLIFEKVKARFGGRVRVIICASAPIAGNVLAFLKCAFCCPIVEGYGQTESTGASFNTKYFDNKTGHVGGPCINVEYKLRDVGELGYTRQSKPYPQGEVLIRSPGVFNGYFKNAALTRQTVKGGWLHTGDVGMVVEGNALKIIDRIKNIFKLSQGEYIVSEKLERQYEQSPFVAQIFIHGDSLRSHIVAIVFPEFTALRDHLVRVVGTPAQDPSLANLTTLLQAHGPLVTSLIQGDLERLATEARFNSLERVRTYFRMVDKEFEVGVVLTPTMKLRRNQAKVYFEALIHDIY